MVAEAITDASGQPGGGRGMGIALIAESTLATLAKLAETSGGGRPSILRLNELVEFRAPLEELETAGDVVEAFSYEHSARPVKAVYPLPPSLERRGLPEPPGMVAVDSSSRHVETAVAAVIVSAVSVSGRGLIELDWPPIHSPDLKSGGPPFVRILPNAEAEGLEGPPPWVTFRNPAGRVYHRDYSVAQAMDEARVELENWALKTIAKTARRTGRLVVFIDGPLYTVPGALVDRRAPQDVAEAWARLVSDRIAAVKALEEAGAAVIGVVKRLSRSSILKRALGPGAPCAPASDYTDEFYLHRAVASGCAGGRRRGQIYKTLKVAVGFRGVPGAPVRIVEFLAIPPGEWQPGPRGLTMVRIEYTEATLETLRRWGLEPHHAYALASLSLGSTLPVPLLASDRRSRAVASALARLVSMEAARLGIPLDYESLMGEAGEAWRRAGL